jgi:hypothetical protein
LCKCGEGRNRDREQVGHFSLRRLEQNGKMLPGVPQSRRKTISEALLLHRIAGKRHLPLIQPFWLVDS